MRTEKEIKIQLISVLVLFFAFSAFFITVANAEAKDFNTTYDRIFLNKINSIQNEEENIALIISFARKNSGKVRMTLEKIAIDTKQKDQIRMQAICSLDNSATRKSVPILLDILETDLKQRRGFWACAIPVLGSLDDRRAIPLLLYIANLNEDHLSGMDHMAIKAVAQLGDEREIPFLASKATIWPVQLSVIKGLARIASLQSIDVLIDALQEAEELEVVTTAESGLLSIGKASLSSLKKALEDNRDRTSRSRIQKLINQINNKKIITK